MVRELDDADPVSGLGPDDPCWCGSALAHVACHGDPLPLSEPGAPITESDDDTLVWISPTATVDREWLESGLLGAPIFLPQEELAPPRVVGPDVVARMMRPPSRVTPCRRGREGPAASFACSNDCSLSRAASSGIAPPRMRPAASSASRSLRTVTVEHGALYSGRPLGRRRAPRSARMASQRSVAPGM